ncbi:MAG: hypothetical protein KTR14_00470 [Vampirovibrio sp.]|nr:hypothetical protein [Vampirovibrio sp.]
MSAQQPEEQEGSAITSVHCPACNYVNLPEQSFCGSCGKQLLADKTLEGAAPVYQAYNSSETDSSTTEAKPSSRLTQQPSQSTELPKSSPQEEITATQSTPPQPDSSTISPTLTESSPPTGISKTKGSAETLNEPSTYDLLDTFAVVSVEMTNLAELTHLTNDDFDRERYQEDCAAFIEERAAIHQGTLESSHRNIFFITFRHQASVKDSANQAVACCMSLLTQPYHIQQTPLQIRAGIDLEAASRRNPAAAATERALAKAGTVLLNQRIYDLLQQDIQVDQIGPLPMGDEMVPFYRVVSLGKRSLPLGDSLLKESPTAPPPSNQEILDTSIQQPSPQATDQQPDTTAQQYGQSPEEQALEGLELLPYIPPRLLTEKMTRSATAGYEKGVETLTQLLSEFITGATGPRGKIIGVSASPGLGKTYITQLVRSQVDPDYQNQQAFWLGGTHYKGFSNPTMPLMFWLEVFQNFFAVDPEGLTQPEVLDQVSRVLNFIYNNEAPSDVVDFFSEFLSAAPLSSMTLDTRARVGLLDHYLGDIITTLSTQKPVILVVEDLEYADAASLDVLMQLVRQGLLNNQVMIYFTYPRETYPDGDFAKVFQVAPFQEVVIDNCDDDACRQYLASGPLAGNMDAIPEDLINRLIAKSGGKPLFMESCLWMMHLEGVLAVDDQGKLTVSNEAAVQQYLFPATVEEVLHTRLGYLSERAQYVLQVASVVGERFSLPVVMALCQLESEEFTQVLEELSGHRLIIPDMLQSGRFIHGLLWQLVYDSLSDELKSELHKLYSEYLEEAMNQERAINPMWVAYHAHQGRLLNRAFHYWNMAGVYMGQIGSLTGLNILFSRALDILPELKEENEEEIEVSLFENLALMNIDRFPEFSIPRFLAVQDYYREYRNTPKEVETLGYLSSCYQRQGNISQALTMLEEALVLVSKQDFPIEYASLLSEKLDCLYTLGKLQQALSLITDEIEPLLTPVAETMKEDTVYTGVWLNTRLIKARIYLSRCNNKVFDLIEDALNRAEPHPHREQFEAQIVSFKLLRTQGFLLKGNYDSCERSLQALMPQIEVLADADRYLARWGLVALSYHCEMGDWENASMLIPSTLYQSEYCKDYLTWITTNTYAGQVAAGMGNINEARKVLEDSVMLSSEYRLAGAALMGWRFLAELELSAGAKEVAEEISARALEIAQKPDFNNLLETYLLSITRSKTLLAHGDVKLAGKTLEAHWPTIAQSGFTPLVARMSCQIGLIYRSLAQVTKGELAQKHQQRADGFLGKSKEAWESVNNKFQLRLLELV